MSIWPLFMCLHQEQGFALANLPDPGKVVPKAGMRPLGNQAGRARHALLKEKQEDYMSETSISIGTPDLLNIPYFAMAAKGATDSSRYHVDQPEILRDELGNQAFDWLLEKEGKQFVGFYATRIFVPPKSASHQKWLVFGNQKSADEFLSLFPELGLKKLEHK